MSKQYRAFTPNVVREICVLLADQEEYPDVFQKYRDQLRELGLKFEMCSEAYGDTVYGEKGNRYFIIVNGKKELYVRRGRE